MKKYFSIKRLSFLLSLFVFLSCGVSDRGKCLERSEKFSEKEISGIWSGKDDLEYYNQYENRLTLNTDGTYKLEIFRNGEMFNSEWSNNGIYFTSVKEIKNLKGLFDHYLTLKWDSPWGERESTYDISYIINPTSGTQSKTGKTDTYSKGFYLTPKKPSFIFQGSTKDGIILQGFMK